jgi:uncharacterized protein YigA (DUF484 family)
MSNLRTRYRELEVIVASLISLNHEDEDLATKVAHLKINALEAFSFKEAARKPNPAAARKLGIKADVTPAQAPGSS